MDSSYRTVFSQVVHCQATIATLSVYEGQVECCFFAEVSKRKVLNETKLERILCIVLFTECSEHNYRIL